MIFNAFERMVALRYLRARREEGFVSVIAGFSLAGIALGVATLIIVMSVMNGFRAELLQRILGLNGHLGVYELTNRPLTDFDKIAGKIAKVDGVVRVIPTVEGQVLVSANSVAAGAIVRGVRPGDIRAREIIADNIRAGSLKNFKGRNRSSSGPVSRGTGVRPGDTVRLFTVQRDRVRLCPAQAVQIGVFEVGMFEYDSAVHAAGCPDYQVEKCGHQYRGVSRKPDQQHPGRDPSHGGQGIADRRLAAGECQLLQCDQGERNVMFPILTLIILVAAFNIISGMIMMVKDKGRDIAILRTMGATRGMVMRVFLLAGASVGIIGTAIGFGLGIAFAGNIETIRQWLQGLTGTELFAAEIYFLSQLPSVVETSDVVSVVAMSLGLSFLAVLYPAWRAARLDPVEALRNE